MTTRMPRFSQFSVFFHLFVAVHLLLFSICPVSSRIYQTNDAVVIEVDDAKASNLAVHPSILSARSNNYGNPAAPIPMLTYAINPFTGLYHQQPNFPFWPYPLLKPVSSVSDVEGDSAATSPGSRQQKIACGVGPASVPQRKTQSGNRIVGGSEATPNSWPFVVGLRKTTNNVLFCGGTLISATRILTVAHCVNKLSAYDISTMTVSLGMHTQGNLPDTFNDAQQTRRVSRVVYHKDYNDATARFDIAVLTIDPPISYSAAISPVCLPAFNSTVNPFVNKDAVIMGWGTVSNDATEASNALQQVTTKVISNAECNVPYENGIKPQQLCAKADGKDPCSGDGGGPLVVQKAEGFPWVQAGVISFGQACADATFPGVYANVAFFRNWINTYMNS